MKLACDLSLISAPSRPTAAPLRWGSAWASPLTAAPAGLVLDFAAGAFGAGGLPREPYELISFSRPTTASVVDAEGMLVASPSHTLRMTHDPSNLARLGLLLENARGNLFAASAAPANQTVTVTAAPHVLSFYGAGSIALSGAHTGTLTGSGAYPARRHLAFTPAAGQLTLALTGQIQAPQLERGGTASSYIPTTTAPGQRADDNAGVSLGPWFDTSAGTLVFSGYVRGAEANDRLIEVDGGSASTRLSLLWNTVLGKPQFQVWNGGALQSAIAPPGDAIPLGAEFRVALAYAPDSFAVSLNGGGVATDSAGSVPTGLSTLRLGRAAGGAQGQIVAESLIYYPARLSNAELQALSA